MCYTGGPRCASHLRKRIVKVQNTVEKALQEQDTTEFLVANAEIQSLQVQFDGTDTGQDMLEEQIAEAKEAGNDREVLALQNRKDIAKNLRLEELADRRRRLEAQGQSESLPATDSAVDTETDPQAYLSNPEYQKLESLVNERIASDEFKTLLAGRDEAREALKAAKKEQSDQKDHLVALEVQALGKKDPETGDPYTAAQQFEAQESMDEEYEKLRTLTDARLDAHYAYHIANDKLEKFKDETAQHVAAMNDITGDPAVAYTSDRLGDCVEVAKYDSGTREWLEERTGGVGGSDIDSMLRLDPEYGQSNYTEFLKSKTEPISEEEVAKQAESNSGFSGPTGRGNAWEPAIVRKYQENNPDAHVMFSKASWAHKDNPHFKANVDGLLSSDGKTPDGILEAKTASDIEKWEGVDENGNIVEKVPVGYRAQVLWYLRQTGFKYADVAALVDDHHYVQRRIYANEAIDPENYELTGKSKFGTMDEAMPVIEQVWNDEVKPRREGTYEAKTHKSTFDKAHEAATIERMSRNMSAWTNQDQQECREYIRGYAKYKKEAAARGERVLNRDAYMVEGLKRGGPGAWTKDRVYVDIETSGMTPGTGEIIEIGMKRVNPQGETVFEYTERYGVRDERTLDVPAVATGMVEVHRITPDDVRGKRSFRSPEVQSIMQEHLNDPNAVMVAHNDEFENGWFNQNVEGYWKAHAKHTTGNFRAKREGKSGDPLTRQDTMWTSRYLVAQTENNKLATFTTGHGIAYENAHAADADTDMTFRAEKAFAKKFQSAPYGHRWNPEGEYDKDAPFITA